MISTTTMQCPIWCPTSTIVSEVTLQHCSRGIWRIWREGSAVRTARNERDARKIVKDFLNDHALELGGYIPDCVKVTSATFQMGELKWD